MKTNRIQNGNFIVKTFEDALRVIGDAPVPSFSDVPDEKGNKGQGGFSLNVGYHLLNKGQLSLDPEKGKRENYI